MMKNLAKAIKIDKKISAYVAKIKNHIDTYGPIMVKAPSTDDGWQILQAFCDDKYATANHFLGYIMLSKRASFDHKFNLDQKFE